MTLAELLTALRALPKLDPIERARQAPRLTTAATVALAEVRTVAIAEALAAGRRQADIARELGVTRSAINIIARRRRTDSEETQ